MVYKRVGRRTLKSRRTYARGSKQFSRAVYRRAYYRGRRGVGRKEKKGVDVDFPGETIVVTTNTNDNIYLLNAIQEGVGSWNRIGRYVWNKSIELDLNLRWSSAYTSTDLEQLNAQWLRCILVWDKQPNNGTIPTWDTMFGHTDQTGTESTSVNDHLRYDNMFRFQVLYDTMINPSMTSANPGTIDTLTSGSGLQQNTLVRLHKFLKLGNRMTNYSGTANPVTNANISTGSLYLILRAPGGDQPTEEWTLMDNSVARLRYVD